MSGNPTVPRTLVAMVSIGDRSRYTRYSFPRIMQWSQKHGLDLVVIRQSLLAGDLPPHFNKLAVLRHFPGFDRYIIVDDDLLLSSRAPAPPSVAAGGIGLVPDSEQRHTRANYVKWTGNTGFIIADRQAAPVFEDVLKRGSDPEIWGFADQSALNRSAWKNNCVEKLDTRWNYMPIIDHVVGNDCWSQWQSSRLFRLRYYAGLLSGFSASRCAAVREAFGVLLVRVSIPRVFERILA